jgi:hypothetical protein
MIDRFSCVGNSADTLVALTQRAFIVVDSTPGGGASFVSSIRAMLQRESRWSAWKDTACPVLVTEPPAPVSLEDEEVIRIRHQTFLSFLVVITVLVFSEQKAICRRRVRGSNGQTSSHEHASEQCQKSIIDRVDFAARRTAAGQSAGLFFYCAFQCLVSRLMVVFS